MNISWLKLPTGSTDWSNTENGRKVLASLSSFDLVSDSVPVMPFHSSGTSIQ